MRCRDHAKRAASPAGRRRASAACEHQIARASVGDRRARGYARRRDGRALRRPVVRVRAASSRAREAARGCRRGARGRGRRRSRTVVVGLREHRAPRVDDHRPPAGPKPGARARRSGSRRPRSLVLDRPRAQEYLPVIARVATVNAAGTSSTSAPAAARSRYSSGKRTSKQMRHAERDAAAVREHRARRPGSRRRTRGRPFHRPRRRRGGSCDTSRESRRRDRRGRSCCAASPRRRRARRSIPRRDRCPARGRRSGPTPIARPSSGWAPARSASPGPRDAPLLRQQRECRPVGRGRRTRRSAASRLASTSGVAVS